MDPETARNVRAGRAGPGRAARRAWLVALVLVTVATSLDAQRRGARRGGAGRGRAQPGVGAPFPFPSNEARKPQSDWALPKETETKGPLLPLYLPGFDSPKKDPTKAVPEPKPKSPAKVDPNVDPMAEADQITAAADHRAAVEAEEARLLAEHFRLCDLDGGGWLSLREAEVTLSLDRADFRRMDMNQDGRLGPGEFSAQSAELLARLGARPATPGPLKPAKPEPLSEPRPDEPAEPVAAAQAAPVPTEPAGTAPAVASPFGSMPVRPRDLLARYDADQSEGLDASEMEKVFLEAGLSLSPELVVAQMDPDDSGELESTELVAIAWMVSRRVPEALRKAPEPAAPPGEAATPAAPERSAGLATHFGLLDAGADGYIDEADLRALQSPARLDLRLQALLSAMDQDGDGRLSASEFRASMGAGPR